LLYAIKVEHIAIINNCQYIMGKKVYFGIREMQVLICAERGNQKEHKKRENNYGDYAQI